MGDITVRGIIHVASGPHDIREGDYYVMGMVVSLRSPFYDQEKVQFLKLFDKHGNRYPRLDTYSAPPHRVEATGQRVAMCKGVRKEDLELISNARGAGPLDRETKQALEQLWVAVQDELEGCLKRVHHDVEQVDLL